MSYLRSDTADNWYRYPILRILRLLCLQCKAPFTWDMGAQLPFHVRCYKLPPMCRCPMSDIIMGLTLVIYENNCRVGGKQKFRICHSWILSICRISEEVLDSDLDLESVTSLIRFPVLGIIPLISITKSLRLFLWFVCESQSPEAKPEAYISTVWCRDWLAAFYFSQKYLWL